MVFKKYDYLGFVIEVFDNLNLKNKFSSNIRIIFSKNNQEWGRVDLCGLVHCSDFKTNDYFQFNILRFEKFEQRGFGDIVHDFIIEKHKELGIENVYSTNEKQDSNICDKASISENAKKFWNRRKEMNKA